MTTSTTTTLKTKEKKEKLTIKNIIRKTLITMGVFAFWVLLWQLVYTNVGLDIIIPSPLGTGRRVLELVSSSDFWSITGSTVLRILAGYLCGVFIGLILAVATYMSKLLYALLKPVISIARATPVASLTVIIIVWVTNQQVPLFIVGLMVFPIIWGNTFEGIKNTDKKLLEMSRSFSVGAFSRLLHIYVPSVYPFFIAGASTALGLAWKSGIAAEILGSTQGSVGQQLNNAKVYLDSEGKFAWTVVVVILSIIFERVVVWALKKSTLHLPVRVKECEKPKAESLEHRGYVVGEGISKAYGENPVLQNVDVEISPSDVVAVRGASGTGKTTLLMILAGLTKADRGRVNLQGGVSFLFQEDRLLPWLTVKENILFVNPCADAQMLLSLVSLQGTENMYPEELSGGMKRRLAIARTLAGRGDVVFLDEPFTGLDEELRQETARRVFEHLKGRAVAIVTHDSDEAQRFANREIIIK
ncbi:MAG: ATP-binding cassette domain-containing protein [Ruminococcus sp.]|nr:ATP-binding cassette domain-containing protein [Ruminococcus sp.]